MSVMVGSLLARRGQPESPSSARASAAKAYRGMGSLGAMNARSFSKDRYFQGEVETTEKVRARRVEVGSPTRGPAQKILPADRRPAIGHGLLGRTPSASCADRSAVRADEPAGLRAAHPRRHHHRRAPNYWM